jgi:hypothetical protein
MQACVECATNARSVPSFCNDAVIEATCAAADPIDKTNNYGTCQTAVHKECANSIAKETPANSAVPKCQACAYSSEHTMPLATAMCNTSMVNDACLNLTGSSAGGGEHKRDASVHTRTRYPHHRSIRIANISVSISLYRAISSPCRSQIMN